MTASKSLLISGAAALIAVAGLAARTASAATRTYVVCNAYNECWRVHKHYSDYPNDLHIVFHDDAWWRSHQSDPQWHWEADPTDDHGWYDKDGVWHGYAPPP
jgi:hypothetical protein